MKFRVNKRRYSDFSSFWYLSKPLGIFRFFLCIGRFTD